MMLHNREVRRSCLLMIGATAVLTVAGACISMACAALVLLACLTVMTLHILTERSRYRRLQRLSAALDELLLEGKTLSIRDYEEGELSVLANQLQKMILLLTESTESIKADREFLAESLANISHQLRTPLTAMNLTTTMLRREGLPDEKRMELTAELRNLLIRTDWLVETLLKISKLDAGTVKLTAGQVPVRKLIEESSAPVAIPMELRNQKLTVNCADESFTGDLVWSTEALGNILKNCMEHTPEGGTITVTAQETPLFTRLTVEDTGPGFDEKDIPHLFERFYRGSNASENSYGIGLALARTIIVAQNGTVQACNGENGAKFVIKFYKQVL